MKTKILPSSIVSPRYNREIISIENLRLSHYLLVINYFNYKFCSGNPSKEFDSDYTQIFDQFPLKNFLFPKIEIRIPGKQNNDQKIMQFLTHLPIQSIRQSVDKAFLPFGIGKG